jgi:hypothetical protein
MVRIPRKKPSLINLETMVVSMGLMITRRQLSIHTKLKAVALEIYARLVVKVNITREKIGKS